MRRIGSSILVSLFIFLLMISCTPQKGMMEDQSGGTEAEDDSYTEFAAKVAPPSGPYKFVIRMEGTGEGQVTVDDSDVCESSQSSCEFMHKGPGVVLRAVYDASKYNFEGFSGVNCLPAEKPDKNICRFTIGNGVAVVVATFY